MDCRTFRELLDRYLSGNLPAHQFDQMVEHEAVCAACHELAAAMMSAPGVAWNQDRLTDAALSAAQSEPGQPEASSQPEASGRPEVGAAWLGHTLDRTVGADCAYVRLRLAEAIDAPLLPDTARRVELHLLGCAPCAALAAVLRDLPAHYDALERLRADHAFAAEIVARTMPARPSWREVLRALVRRPEALWEGAVVCALLTTPLAGPSMTDLIRSARQAGGRIEQHLEQHVERRVEQRIGQEVALAGVPRSLGNHVIAAAAEVGATIDGGRRSVLDGLTRMRARFEDSITAAIDTRAASDPRVAVVAPALKDALGRIGLIADDSVDHVQPARAGESAAEPATAPAAAGPSAPRDSSDSASPKGPAERFGATAAPGHQGTEVESDELRQSP